MNETTMSCPGCGKPGVSRTLVACPACWFQLPQEMRRDVTGAARGGINHMRAIGAARNWLKANSTT